jgi:hypothetical protein
MIYVNVNSTIYSASGVLELVGEVLPAPTPTLPARNYANVTPVLTANSSAGCVASASSEYSEGGVTASAYKAFNGVTGSGWANGYSSAVVAPPHWLMLELAAPVPIYSFDWKIRTDANTLAPIDAEFLAWNGSEWVSLYTTANLAWANGERKGADVAVPGIYSKIKMWIGASGPLCQIDELRIFS